MGNCGTKPKTSEGDDAPPPAELQAPATAGVDEGERKDEEVAAPEEASQPVVAPQSEVRKMISNSHALSIHNNSLHSSVPNCKLF